MSGDYWAQDVTIRRADIQGMYRGFAQSRNTPGTLTIENSYFRNYSTNIEIQSLATPGTRATAQARRTVIDNVRFDPYPGAPSFTTIEMFYNPSTTGGNNFIQKDEVFVYSYNGVLGDNFQLYYVQQSPDFIVPKTTYYGPDNNGDGIPDNVDSLGCPEAGLTNQQAWAKYSIAIAGAVAPTSATRANVSGFVRAF